MQNYRFEAILLLSAIKNQLDDSCNIYNLIQLIKYF